MPAEVVYDEDAAVGDSLYRRSIKPESRTVAQLELIEPELTAHHDSRAAAPHPPPVDVVSEVERLVGHLVDRLVVHRIEEPDDAALDFEGVRNEDVAVEQIMNRLRDDRLAIARRAVHEHRVPGIDGGPELVQDALADHQMREGLAHVRASHLVGYGGLERFHVAPILRERHGRHAHIVALFEEQHRTRAARVRDAIRVRGCAQRAPRHVEVILLLAGGDHRLDDVERKSKPLGELGPGQLACEVERLENQLRHQVAREPGL